MQLPLNWKACEALAAWLRERHELAGSGATSDTIFLSKFRRAMSARAIRYLVKKYLARAGVRGASVHSLRHTMGRPFGRLINTSLDVVRHQERAFSPWRPGQPSEAGPVSFQGT